MPSPESLGILGIATALAGGAVRGSIPYMYVSLGECLTEKSGRINLGMEGILLIFAITAAHAALRISPLFFLGIAAAFLLHYAFERTRWGLHLRAVGDAPEAARSMGIAVRRHRVVATTIGGALAGIGGSHLTLYFP